VKHNLTNSIENFGFVKPRLCLAYTKIYECQNQCLVPIYFGNAWVDLDKQPVVWLK